MPLKHFPSIDRNVALGRPILYSNWMTKNYVSVDREELRGYVKARLKVRERERETLTGRLWWSVTWVRLTLV